MKKIDLEAIILVVAGLLFAWFLIPVNVVTGETMSLDLLIQSLPKIMEMFK